MTAFVSPIGAIVAAATATTTARRMQAEDPFRPATLAEISTAVGLIKERARRLRPPLSRWPEAFHEDKSEIVRDLELLEDAIRKGRQLPAQLRSGVR